MALFSTSFLITQGPKAKKNIFLIFPFGLIDLTVFDQLKKCVAKKSVTVACILASRTCSTSITLFDDDANCVSLSFFLSR